MWILSDLPTAASMDGVETPFCPPKGSELSKGSEPVRSLHYADEEHTPNLGPRLVTPALAGADFFLVVASTLSLGAVA